MCSLCGKNEKKVCIKIQHRSRKSQMNHQMVRLLKNRKVRLRTDRLLKNRKVKLRTDRLLKNQKVRLRTDKAVLMAVSLKAWIATPLSMNIQKIPLLKIQPLNPQEPMKMQL